MDMPSDTWRAQERQDNAAKVEILVDGSPEWRPHLNVMTRVGEHFAEWCGGADVSLLKAMRVEAWANDVAFERCVGNEFLNRGYTLEAMEVDFTNNEEKKWGRSVWYKEHPSYERRRMEGMFKGVDPKWRSFIWSMFKTEHAGDKMHGLFSMQMASASLIGMPSGILLHKAMIYHKIAFSSPAKAAEHAA